MSSYGVADVHHLGSQMMKDTCENKNNEITYITVNQQ